MAMKEEKIRLLIEGAYAQTSTLPGFWLKYEEFRTIFNDLVRNQGEETIDIDTELFRLYPDTAVEENYQIKGTEEIFRAIRLAPNKLTETRALRKAIETIYRTAGKDIDGWTNFASFGLNGLKEKCVEMGFMGIRQAVQCIFGKRFEFRQGDTTKHEAPVLIRDLKEYGQIIVEEPRNDENNYKPGIVPKACVPTTRQGSYLGEALDKYAYFPKSKDIVGYGWDIAINRLVNESGLLDERWFYYEKDKTIKPILKRYISYTFERLCHEDEEECRKAREEKRLPKKKILENERYAVWNTGLVNYLYEPIYAFFYRNGGRNPQVHQPWIFKAFDTANSYQQGILAQFSNRPSRAEYFSDPSELFYDLKAGVPTYNRDHIFFDNIDRLPVEFIKKDATDGFCFVDDIDHLSLWEKKEYKARLVEAIKQDIDWFDSMNTRFKQAVERAVKRVEWNYKTAIPTYYIEEREISILLPLALESKGRVNVALVCKHNYKPEKGINNYEGKTILTLEMAYNNARLITRPDSDWLLNDMKPNDNTQGA